MTLDSCSDKPPLTKANDPAGEKARSKRRDGLLPSLTSFRRSLILGLTGGHPASDAYTSQQATKRRRRLVQVESALACNLRCIMCPWKDFRKTAGPRAIMSQEVWESLRPHLHEVQSVDFTGGGEPLLQPQLMECIHILRWDRSSMYKPGIWRSNHILGQGSGHAKRAVRKTARKGSS
jgi:hypothetical protein